MEARFAVIHLRGLNQRNKLSAGFTTGGFHHHITATQQGIKPSDFIHGDFGFHHPKASIVSEERFSRRLEQHRGQQLILAWIGNHTFHHPHLQTVVQYFGFIGVEFFSQRESNGGFQPPLCCNVVIIKSKLIAVFGRGVAIAGGGNIDSNSPLHNTDEGFGFHIHPP